MMIGGQKAHEARVLENLRLAYKVASRFKVFSPEDMEELKSASVVGLVEASLRWDPEQGKFSTYAWYWCRKHASEAYRVIRAPVTTSRTATQVVGVSDEVLTDNEQADGDHPLEARDLVSHSPEDAVLDGIVRQQQVGLVLDALDALSETERVCVRLYHGIDCRPMHTSEIGKVMGFSRQAAHQNMVRGMAKMMERLEDRGIIHEEVA